MTTLRKRPPPLEPQLPLCGVCGNEVEATPDGYGCANCEATWSADWVGSRPGEWEHPDAPQCESVDGRFLPGGAWAREHPDPEICRCILHAGHAFDHEFSAVGAHRSWPDNASATEGQLSRNAVEVQA